MLSQFLFLFSNTTTENFLVNNAPFKIQKGFKAHVTGTAGPSNTMWKTAAHGLNSSLFFLAFFSVQTQTHYKLSSPWFQNVHIVSNGSKSGSETSLLPLLSPFALGSLVIEEFIVSKICKHTCGPLVHQCAHDCVTLFAGEKHWQPPLTTLLFLLRGLLTYSGFLFHVWMKITRS